jgi:hypothetical protein
MDGHSRMSIAEKSHNDNSEQPISLHRFSNYRLQISGESDRCRRLINLLCGVSNKRHAKVVANSLIFMIILPLLQMATFIFAAHQGRSVIFFIQFCALLLCARSIAPLIEGQTKAVNTLIIEMITIDSTNADLFFWPIFISPLINPESKPP